MNELPQAVLNGDLQLAKKLIEEQADVNGHTAYPSSLLIHAAEHYNPSMVKLLIQARARLEDTNHNKDTALLVAINAGYKDITKMLIEARGGVSVPARDGRTPLIIAADKNQCDVVRMLIAADANVNKADNMGRTALSVAAEAGNVPIVAELLRGKNVSLEKPSSQGKTVLMYALQSLKGYCGKVERDLIEMLLNARARIDVKDSRGVTPLMMAAELQDTSVIQKFLTKDDIDVRDAEKCTALVRSIRQKNSIAARALIQAGANVNIKSNHETALIISLTQGSWDLAKALITAKADVNIPVQRAGSFAGSGVSTRYVRSHWLGMTPLSLMLHSKNIKMATHLLEARARVDSVDSQGSTALMFAVMATNDASVVRLVCQRFLADLLQDDIDRLADDLLQKIGKREN